MRDRDASGPKEEMSGGYGVEMSKERLQEGLAPTKGILF